ncbi:MAG: TonB family protein [Candidatus Nitrohelix vancouverensis]|uniref:TonB family protein n=1 Tax=Candidatus Nitrohelix vancouverensis TaxID=2705534 RepID=A0A7T0BZV3_9BACT|nr:MAG: TonB family protein [Candidatus Nitrohelix vancouverensis]
MQRTADFNQMLVASVFFHLLLMALAFYLPQQVLRNPIELPVFHVAVVELPGAASGENIQAPASSGETVALETPPSAAISPKPIATKPEASAPTKKIAPPKPVTEKKTAPAKAPENKALALLNELSGGEAAKKSLVEELDQVARLQPRVNGAKQTADALKLQEKLNALDEVKQTQTKKQPAPPKPIPEAPIQDFEKFKMKEKSRVEAARKSADDAQALRDAEFEALKNKKAPAPSPTLSALERLEELERLTALNALQAKRNKADSMDKPRVEDSAKAPQLAPLSKREKGDLKALDAIVKSLESLSGSTADSVDIKTAPVEVQTRAPSTQGLRGLAVAVESSAPASGSKNSITANPPVGVDNGSSGGGQNLQAMYVALIQRKVDEKWKTPLGSENRSVQVSFYIYVKGNIDKPRLIKSSGNRHLDSLAVQAILDAEPLPPFPEGLDMANMHLTLNFTYKPEKS